MSDRVPPELPSRAPSWLPSPLTLAGIVAMVVLALVAMARGLADADYFWHVRTGRLIVESGAVPSTDPYSFTYGGPWTAHEWLGEVVIHALVSGVGAGWTLLLFGALAGAAIWLSVRALGPPELRAGPAVLALGIGTVVLASYVTVRPQVLSWFLLAVLLRLLLSLSPDSPRRVLWLAPLFVLWANLHGLYVIGLVIVGAYVLATFLGRTPMSANRAGVTWAAGGLLAALAASAVTPAGPAGLLYPLRYVQPDDWGLVNISEWQSPDFHDPATFGLLLLIVAVAVAGGRNVPGWRTAVALIGVVLALVSVRNGPVAAVLSVGVIAGGMAAILPAGRAPRGPLVARRVMETGVAVVAIAAALVVLGPAALTGFREPRPSAGLPVDAVERLRATDPDARVLAEYGWGGYVIHEMFDDGARVFVDGRNDMYPRAVLDDYSALRSAADGWETLLADYGVDAILLPPSAPLAGAAEVAGDWCRAYEDEVATLLLTDCPPD